MLSWLCARFSRLLFLLFFFSSSTDFGNEWTWSFSIVSISQIVFIKTCSLRREALIKSHLFVRIFEETSNNCCVKMHPKKIRWYRCYWKTISQNVIPVNEPVLCNEFRWLKLKWSGWLAGWHGCGTATNLKFIWKTSWKDDNCIKNWAFWKQTASVLDVSFSGFHHVRSANHLFSRWVNNTFAKFTAYWQCMKTHEHICQISAGFLVNKSHVLCWFSAFRFVNM